MCHEIAICTRFQRAARVRSIRIIPGVTLYKRAEILKCGRMTAAIVRLN